MTTNFWRKNKALGIFFIAGVIFLTSAITYITVAAPTTWTQTDWSGGQSDNVVVAAADLGNLYKAASPYIDISQSGEISVNNITTNSSFESDVTDWNYNGGPGTSISWEDTIIYSGNGAAQLDTAFDESAYIYQNINVAEAGNYILSAYVYYDGGIIDNSITQLYYDGAPIATNYESMAFNWYRLTATISDDASGPKSYGVYKAIAHVEPLYIDDIELYAETNILESSIFDMGNPQFWANLSYTTDGLGTTAVKVRTGDTDDLSDANDFNNPACTTIPNATDLSNNGCVDDGDRYIQYQIQLSPTYNANIEYPTFEKINLEGNLSFAQFSTNSNSGAEDLVNSNSIAVVLNGRLEEDVTIDYTITGTATNGTDYDLLTDGTLTITAGNLSNTIDITGIVADILDEDDETIIITLSNPVNTSLGTRTVYTYTINDDDAEPNVSWFTSAEMVSEDFGAPVTITAILDNPSGKEITVPFDITGTAVGGGVDYTLDPETPSPLVIPAGDTQASFDIIFNNENIYENDETIIATIDIGNLINATTNGIDPTEETVTIMNDEAIPTIAFTVNNSNNNEDVSPVNIEVSLSGESSFTSQVDYTVTGGTATNGEDYTLVNSSVTIPAGETTANISLTVIDNEITEGDETIEITLSNPHNVDLGVNSIHTYTINDDDAPGLNISAISGDTTEGGISQTFTIELNTEPNGDVVIDFNSTDTSEGTVSPSTFIFDNTNWNIPQTITVTGADDFLADGDITYQINIGIDTEFIHVDPEHTTDTTGYAGLGLETVNVTNLDDDTLAITVTPTSLTTHEYGSTATFDVVLGSQPDGDVAIDILSEDLSEGTVSDGQIIFNDINWNTPQTVTVTGQDDVDQDGDITYNVTLTINPAGTTDGTGYGGLNPDDVSVTNEDDDTPGIDISIISDNTTEVGGTATFTVILMSQPSNDVTITLSSDNENEGTVNPSSLTFTNANWNTPQTVTVTGVDDDIDDGDIAYNIITAPAVSIDGNYNDLNAADVPITNEDDDTAGITVSAITGDTNEAGGTATFSIQLDSKPLNNVTIDISSDDATEGSVNLPSITITPETWSTPRGITVTGLDDNIVDGDIAYNIILDAAVSLDLNYNGINPDDVAVTNTDNDSIGFTVTQSGGSTNVTEGGTTDSYTVRLNTIPTDNVVVTITPNAQITVTPTTLTFTPANWNINQTVTVTAVNDTTVESNHTGTISHSVASADLDYHGFTISNITAAITDNDRASSGGGGGGFWFPSSNPSEPTQTQTATDPQREQRLEKLRSMGVYVHGLVKIPDDGNPNTTFDNIVYYIGTDGKRHVFPNADIYKTWYDSFRYVRVYPMETLSQIPLGDNVRYKPGVKMIKFKSNNRVYAVEAGGKLRWIMNEKIAWYMYGPGWQKHIVNIPDSLFPSYEFADDISHSNQFNFVEEANKSQNISMDLGL